MAASFKLCTPRGLRAKLGNTSYLGVACWVCSLSCVCLFALKQKTSTNVNDVILEKKEVFSNEAMLTSPSGYKYEGTSTSYNKDMPLIFIGGMPRSGTTLMRAMLDAHPDVRCGQETLLIPRLLFMRYDMISSLQFVERLENAGITSQVMDDAITQFILEVIVKHGKFANRLCNKDPLTLKFTKYLKKLFPNTKFILMIRDGRATAHSIVSRRITIQGYNITSYRAVLEKWNHTVEIMVSQCIEVGPETCLIVHYEQLVLQPIIQSKKILNFLDIPWNDAVLNHEKHISNISLSKTEQSTDQVQRPLYLEALTKWFGQIPEDVMHDMPQIAPMLVRLGYDPTNPRPYYGDPDEWVLSKIRSEIKRS